MGLDDTTPVIPEWAMLWHPARGELMPPSLACRLIVPLLVTKRHEPEPVEAER